MSSQLEWADRILRRLAAGKCLNPCDVYGVKEDCGEVFLCGGMCARCSAVRYVERYPEPTVKVGGGQENDLSNRT